MRNDIYACPYCGHGEYRINYHEDGQRLTSRHIAPSVMGDEGETVLFCYSCDEELTVESLTEQPEALTNEDIAYERAQNSLEWERLGGGGL